MLCLRILQSALVYVTKGHDHGNWAGARLGVPVGPARLTPLVGVARAKELIFTGRVVGAEEAAAIGLVHDTVPAAEAEAAALWLAAHVAAHDPTGVAILKAAFRELDGAQGRVAHENELLEVFQRKGAACRRARGRSAAGGRARRTDPTQNLRAPAAICPRRSRCSPAGPMQQSPARGVMS